MSSENLDVVKSARAKLTGVGLLLAIIGFGFSFYSTMHHLDFKANGETTYSCNINETLSCDHVAASPYSEVFEVPLGVWGMGFFLGMILLLGIPKIVPKNEEDCLQSYAVIAVIGLICSVGLGILSTIQIGAICLTCTGVYAVCAAQMMAVWIFRAGIPIPISYKSVSNGGLVAILGVTVVVVIFQFARPTIHSPLGRQDSHDEASHSAQTSSLSPVALDIPIDKSRYSGFGEDFRKGSDEAKVKIIEFADFQCPACGHASKVLSQVFSIYGDKIQIVFKNFPLDPSCNSLIQRKIHPHACQAAKLARCAGERGNFWMMHDRLFDQQDSLSDANMRAWARQAGLSDNDIAECLESADLQNKIKDDISLADRIGVQSTPTIFINGRAMMGQRTVDSISKEIDRILNK